MVVKIPFGKRENEIVHISEITNNERGIKCNCVCVNCGERLVAKIGGKKKQDILHIIMSVSVMGGLKVLCIYLLKIFLIRERR